MECFRRIALTGLAVFVYPDSSAQIAIVLLLSTIFMVLSEILSPFSCHVEMWLYRAGHYVVFSSMFLALLLRVDISDENERSQEVFSGIIVLAHAVMIIVVVGQGLLICVGWERPCPEELRETPSKGLDDCAIDDIILDGNPGGNEIGGAGKEHNLNPLYGVKETPTTSTRGQGGLFASTPSSAIEEKWNNRSKSVERHSAASKTFLMSDLSRPTSSALPLSAFKTAPSMHSTRQAQDVDRSRRGRSLNRNQRPLAVGKPNMDQRHDNAGKNATPPAPTPGGTTVLRANPPTPTSVVNKTVGGDTQETTATGENLAREGAKAKALSPRSWLSSVPPGERPKSSPVFSGRELFGGRSARWGGWTASLLSAEEKSEMSDSKCSDDFSRSGRSWSPRGRLFHTTTGVTTEGGNHTSVAMETVCISPSDIASRRGSDATATPDANVRRSSRIGRRSLTTGGAKWQTAVTAHPSSPSTRRRFLSNPVPATFTTQPSSYDLACGGIIVSPAETPRTDMGQGTPRSLAGMSARTGDTDSTLPREARTPKTARKPRQSFFLSPADRRSSPLRERKMWVPGSSTIEEDKDHTMAYAAGRKSRSARKAVFRGSATARVAPRSGQEGQDGRGSHVKGMASWSSCSSLMSERVEIQQTGTTNAAGKSHGTDDASDREEGVMSKSRDDGVYAQRGNARSVGSAVSTRPPRGLPIEVQRKRGAKSDKMVVAAESAGGGHKEPAGWHPIFRSPTC